MSGVDGMIASIMGQLGICNPDVRTRARELLRRSLQPGIAHVTLGKVSSPPQCRIYLSSHIHKYPLVGILGPFRWVNEPVLWAFALPPT